MLMLAHTSSSACSQNNQTGDARLACTTIRGATISSSGSIPKERKKGWTGTSCSFACMSSNLSEIKHTEEKEDGSFTCVCRRMKQREPSLQANLRKQTKAWQGPTSTSSSNQQQESKTQQARKHQGIKEVVIMGEMQLLRHSFIAFMHGRRGSFDQSSQ